MYCVCQCKIPPGNVINIFLSNDLLLHPSACHLLFIRVIIFMTWSTDCNLCVSVTHTRMVKDWCSCLYAVKKSCWLDRGFENINNRGSTSKRPHVWISARQIAMCHGKVLLRGRGNKNTECFNLWPTRTYRKIKRLNTTFFHCSEVYRGSLKTKKLFCSSAPALTFCSPNLWAGSTSCIKLIYLMHSLTTCSLPAATENKSCVCCHFRMEGVWCLCLFSIFLSRHASNKTIYASLLIYL